MALSKDRTGRIHGPIQLQQDFDLPADAEVFIGGLYRVVDGMLALPADSEAQNDCITVMSLQWKDNRGGQDRGARARCMVDGVAVMPVGTVTAVTAASIGKPVYPTSDDAVVASAATTTGNQPAGTLLAVERAHIKIKLG